MCPRRVFDKISPYMTKLESPHDGRAYGQAENKRSPFVDWYLKMGWSVVYKMSGIIMVIFSVTSLELYVQTNKESRVT